jgi:hypothetical protein
MSAVLSSCSTIKLGYAFLESRIGYDDGDSKPWSEMITRKTDGHPIKSPVLIDKLSSFRAEFKYYIKYFNVAVEIPHYADFINNDIE